MERDKIHNAFSAWRQDWNKFCRDVLRISLDREQQAIISSVQHNRMTSVVSGTARGKDFVTAAACICFLYLTPEWDDKGEMIGNTKVAMTAPTDRQVGNIMFPEISRIFQKAKYLPGRLVGYDIRTGNKEWFLTGFKADEHQHEAWSGFHAVNTMFAVTEASGIPESVFQAIEGNLQGNSRIILVFNPNISTGYAAESQRSPRWNKFRLNSLNAPNVLQRKIVIPGQVDYEWVKDKVDNWAYNILQEEYNVLEGDFEFEGQWYRPNDLFRIKVLGLFPKVSEGVLVPPEWIELANKRWKEMQQGNTITPQGINGTPARVAMVTKSLRLGVDVAGMGRDSSCFIHRFGNYVDKFEKMHGGGKANHMEVTGKTLSILRQHTNPVVVAQAFIDTIGEGAGCYSRLDELSKSTEPWLHNVFHSCKFSEAAEYNEQPLKDQTGQYQFLNLRAYLYWSVRDWLNPDNKNEAALPEDDELLQELSETQWKFMSNGKIQIEPKEELKKRIKRSPDKSDALANTFYPAPDIDPRPAKKKSLGQFFH